MSQQIETPDSSGGRRSLSLALWFAAVAAVAVLGSWVTLPKIPSWYAGLAKPSFTPPNAVFGPVWAMLYAMMAVAVWRIGGLKHAAHVRAVVLFAVQLALNAIWSPIFFGLEAPKAGLAVIVALLAVLAVTVRSFWQVDRVAGLLLVPYLVWVCYAAALNLAIAMMN